MRRARTAVWAVWVALVWGVGACADGDRAPTGDAGAPAVPPCGPSGPEDRDRDGHEGICLARGSTRGSDCDDGDPLRFPGNEEVCDQEARDEDCDPSTVGDIDRDDDGFVDVRCCNQTSDARSCGDDCYDLRTGIHPGAEESCDGFDEDCDGDSDEGAPRVMLYPDLDHDGHGALDATPEPVCEGEHGYAATNDDCDDADPERHPAMPEICDDRDNDCDGDAEAPGGGQEIVWYTDGDSDGFGSERLTAVSCEPPPFPILCNEDIAPNTCFVSKPFGAVSPMKSQHHVDGLIPFVAIRGDCDDVDGSNHPGARERCEAADNDCDGRADFAIGVNDFEDDDGDLHIDRACNPDADCDDMDRSSHPGAEEVCDRFDNDCDGKIDEGVTIGPWRPDRDGDGFGDDTSSGIDTCAWVPGRTALSGDCGDDDPERHTGARERCNALDDDCDGRVDEIVSACGALGTLSGSVVARADARAVANAQVRPFDAQGRPLGSAKTDSLGSFAIEIPAGTVTLAVDPPADSDLVGIVRALETPAENVLVTLDAPARWERLASDLGTDWDPSLGLVVLQFDGVSPRGGQGALLAPPSGAAVARVGTTLADGGLLPSYAPPLAVLPDAPFAEVAFFDVAPGMHAIPLADLASPNGFSVPNCMVVNVEDPGDPARASGKRLTAFAWPVFVGSVTLLRVDCSIGLGNCCAAHGGDGCDEPAIERCVCDADPTCCAPGGWSERCAEQVTRRSCSSCPAVVPDGAACCAPHDAFGCRSGAIEACVCQTKPECCVGTWARDCAGSVRPLRCGLCPAPDAGVHDAGFSP